MEISEKMERMFNVKLTTKELDTIIAALSSIKAEDYEKYAEHEDVELLGGNEFADLHDNLVDFSNKFRSEGIYVWGY